MADQPKRVPVLAPDGSFGTVDAGDVDSLPDGARVLTQEEYATKKLDTEYGKASTGQKIGGLAASALPVAGTLLQASGAVAIPPELDAFRSGVSDSLTGGLGALAEKGIIGAVGGDEAARSFVQREDDLGEAHPYYKGAGQVAGLAAGVLAGGAGSLGGKAAGGVMSATSMLGSPIEQATVKALGGLAAKGAIGKAATVAAGMAARGAVENAALSAVQQAANDGLHDEPITGEKIYGAAGHGALSGLIFGGALGLGSSLAGSALKGTASKVGSKLEGAATEAESIAKGSTPFSAEPQATPRLKSGGKTIEAEASGAPEARSLSSRVKSVESALTDSANPVRAQAQQQAWNAVGAGFGLQTSRYAKEATKYFGDTKALGEIAIRHGLIDMGAAEASPLGAAWAAAKSGTVADIVPKAAAALDDVGKQIGDITQASGARIKMSNLDEAVNKLRTKYDRIAGNEHVVNAIDNYVTSLKSKLGNQAEVSLQDLLEQRKGLDDIVYRETKTLDPGRRVAALREVRGEMEGLISKGLDEASGEVPGALKSKYESLKRDYHGLRIINEAAEDSAARASKGASLGLGEKFAVGSALASGNFMAAPVLAMGGKVIRERGNAAAAAFLSKVADRGTLASLVNKFDQKVANSASGVLREAPSGEPKAGPYQTPAKLPQVSAEEGRAQTATVRKQGEQIMKWIGDARSNPARVMDQLQDAAEMIGKTAGPKAAESYTASTLRAIGFIAGHIPIKERRDPLDPRSTPPLTYDEASRLVRAAKYATKPETVYDDFERGIITPEGLRAAKTFTPESFAEFQAQLQSHVENHMLRNRQLTQSQRLNISKLLGYPAGADLKPQAIARLQANLMQAPSGASPADQPNGNGPPNPPVDMKVQQTGFDAVEARHSS